ncbi:CpaD family pilus assembly lipoprotein [Castellaniella sp. MT123]|uniref:CpaD family pilus assembly lipoprotein n=1 Tax=Castellaniella sp. MT123 TaxID=3140381 RepID=UPI0031F465DB
MTSYPIHFHSPLRWLVVCGSIGLLAGCSFPKRDYSFVPDASVIQVQLKDGRWVAVPPDCAKLFTEPPRSLYDSRPQVPYGCATYTNLANSVANPRDLVAPGTYEGQQADSAAGAVKRYRDNKVTPLRETNSTKKPSSSGNSSSNSYGN